MIVYDMVSACESSKKWRFKKLVENGLLSIHDTIVEGGITDVRIGFIAFDSVFSSKKPVHNDGRLSKAAFPPVVEPTSDIDDLQRRVRELDWKGYFEERDERLTFQATYPYYSRIAKEYDPRTARTAIDVANKCLATKEADPEYSTIVLVSRCIPMIGGYPSLSVKPVS